MPLWFLASNLVWFLPAIILLGSITSYTDLKESRVKNKHVVLALFYALIAYSIIIYINLGHVRLDYFVELAVMCALSLATGFMIWYVGLWTAGDAKLFFAYSALIPLSVYKYGHMPYFDSSNILINTFVPVFFYFFFMFMFRTTFKQKLFFLKKSLQPREVFSLLMSLFAFTWIITLIFKFFHFQVNYFLTISLLFLIIMLFEKVISGGISRVLAFISLLRLVFDHTVYSLAFVKGFLLIVVLFILLRFFVLRAGFSLLTKEVDINLLKRGMVPAELVYFDNGRYRKEERLTFSFFSSLRRSFKGRDYLFNPEEALSWDDVTKLKRLRSKLGFEHLRIQQTVPFAPILFFGVLLTIFVQGNVLLALASLL